MRRLLVASALFFQADLCGAQQPDLAQAPSNAGNQVFRPLGSTLSVGSGKEGALSLMESYPAAEASPSSTTGAEATEADVPKTPDGMLVRGFILNRQLYETIAREYPPSGVQIGQGWNSFLNRPSANICIEGEIAIMPGKQISSRVSVAEDHASYLEAVSGSAGGSYGPFSGSASYSRTHNFSEYDANVVMTATVDTGGEFVSPGDAKAVRLSDVALELLNSPQGLARFVRACGDSYVTSYRNGGRMNSLLTIKNVTQDEKETIAAQAKGGFGAFSASGSFSQTIASASGSNRLEVTYEQVGGVIAGLPTTVEEHLAKFSQFSVGNEFNPRPYVFHTVNYRSLANWPPELDNRVSPVDQEYLVLSYYNFSDLATDYDRVIREPERFLGFLIGGSDYHRQLRDEALHFARKLDTALGNCVQKQDCSVETIKSWDEEFAAAMRRLQDDTGNTAPAGATDANSLAIGTIAGFVRLAATTPGSATDPAQPGGASALTAASEPVLPDLVVRYYRLLAGLPLLRGEQGVGFTAPAGKAGGEATDEAIIIAFRDWLIANRLRPATQSYCSRSANHPLCLTDWEMAHIVGLLDIAAGPFRPAPVPPPPPPDPLPKPKKTKPKPVPDPRPERFHGMCGSVPVC